MKILILTFVCLLLCGTAKSDQWYSAAHFGFANEDRSSTGFKDSAGSMSFLDVGYRYSEQINFGLRNLMQGGQKPEISYYRMGSGPMLLWLPKPEWIIHGSYTFFNETALDDSGEKAYRSQGRSIMLGWEKVRQVSTNLQVVYGGFMTQHSGKINLTSAISPAHKQRLSNVETNHGLSHGVEIALRMYF